MVLTRFRQYAERGGVAGFLYALLTGAGQVMFQAHPLTGFLFLAGIFYASVPVGLAGLLGLVVATLTGWLMGIPYPKIVQGLYGYNGILTGLAVATFLKLDLWAAVLVVIGAAFSTLVTAACDVWLGRRAIPTLTTPFVLVTWVLLLATYFLARVHPAGLPAPGLPQVPHPTPDVQVDVPSLARGVVSGVGQVMLIDNLVTGLAFIAGLAVSSWPAAAMAVMGSLLGVLTGVILGGPADWVAPGLYGFNGALAAVAMGTVFRPPAVRSALEGAAGAVLSTLVQAAMVTALKPLGIPVLTMPFIVTTWVLVLAGQAREQPASTGQDRARAAGGMD